MYDNYKDACDAVLSRQQAIRQLHLHGVPADVQEEFFAEVGDKASFTGKEVLDWLGY